MKKINIFILVLTICTQNILIAHKAELILLDTIQGILNSALHQGLPKRKLLRLIEVFYQGLLLRQQQVLKNDQKDLVYQLQDNDGNPHKLQSNLPQEDSLSIRNRELLNQLCNLKQHYNSKNEVWLKIHNYYGEELTTLQQNLLHEKNNILMILARNQYYVCKRRNQTDQDFLKYIVINNKKLLIQLSLYLETHNKQS